MRPTGKLHLGHLVGALQNWEQLQAQYDCFYFVADWHALTSNFADTGDIVDSAIDNVADWIGAGIDPERSTLFVQSMVPEHAELYLLLQMVTPIPWLERVPTYKEQIEQLADKDLSSIGFLGYPLLQTADVIIYNAHFVPVGDDQVPHLELSREVVRRFHNFYGEVFVEPQALLTPTPRLPGLDNRKMSKSYGNTIDLSDDAETVKKKIRSDVHRSQAGPRRYPGHRRRQPGLHLPRCVQPESRGSRRSQGALSRGEGRRRRGQDQARQRRQRDARADSRAPAAALARPGYIRELLVEGSRKARAVAAGNDGARARRREVEILNVDEND